MLPAVVLAATLSKPPVIELYTMSPGTSLFTKFGHAAICVTRGRSSRCYNYGTTDFASPPQDIGWDFLRGESKFWVSVWPRERMLRAYRGEDRGVWRQRIPLDAERARAVAAKLEHDALPENRYYVYDHLRDNCSTRLRDLLDEASGGELRADTRGSFGVSYRELGSRGLAELPVASFLGHYLVGRSMDRDITRWEAMFLPHVLRAEVQRTFGAEPELITASAGPRFPERAPATAGWQALLAATVGLPPLVAAALRRRERLARAFAASLVGLIGCLVWLLAAISAVPDLRGNEALAVFWPTDLAAAWLPERWQRRYVALRCVVLAAVALCLLTGAFRQPLWLPWLAAALPFGVWQFRLRRRSAPAPA